MTGYAEHADQASFRSAWDAAGTSALGPTAMAMAGGALADRAAWVFVAGYQAAVRQCFDVGAYRGWGSYLVSERREASGEPTCWLSLGGDGASLQGSKSWLAAASDLDFLVVNATLRDEPGRTRDVVLAADVAGVAVEPRTGGRFLPELEQGGARFDAVALDATNLLDGERVFGAFAFVEARCLVLAHCGHFLVLRHDVERLELARELAEGLATAELASTESLKLLIEAQTLLLDWFADWVAEPPARDAHWQRWHDDQRLVGMHRPIAEKRLAKALAAAS
ncbi:MAG: hypothetical protein AAF515_15810 [Pseudomonadota bacterium]